MSAANAVGTTRSEPAPAHDPIAIAALVAALPELEADLSAANEKVKEVMEVAKAVREKLNAHQARIDAAIKALKNKAPKDSRWGAGEKSAEDIDMLRQHLGQLQQKQIQALGMQNAGNNANNFMIQAAQGVGPNGAAQAILDQIRREEHKQRIQGVVAPPPTIKNREWTP